MAITIVYGAPCSGKTTYVQKHAKKGELIWDWDAVEQAISGNNYQEKTPEIRALLLDIREQVIQFMEDNCDEINCWYITTFINDALLQRFSECVSKHLVTPKITEKQCLSRLLLSERADVLELEAVIVEWFEQEGFNSPPR